MFQKHRREVVVVSDLDLLARDSVAFLGPEMQIDESGNITVFKSPDRVHASVRYPV